MSRYINLDDALYLRENGELELYCIDPDAPSIDIVHCTECKWRYVSEDTVDWCGVWANACKSDGFCSYGERSSE